VVTQIDRSIFGTRDHARTKYRVSEAKKQD
jgi:hypothetical protein